MTGAIASQVDAVLKGLGMGCAVLALALPGQVISTPSKSNAIQRAVQQLPRVADFAAEEASADVRQMAHWVMDQRDHRGMPFVIVDKPHVRVFVFKPDGTLDGATPALMGSAAGTTMQAQPSTTGTTTTGTTMDSNTSVASPSGTVMPEPRADRN